MTLAPEAGKFYLAQVHGYAIKDEGKFTMGETIGLPSEPGTLVISGTDGIYKADYSFTADALTRSRIAQDPLAVKSSYTIEGALTLRDAESTTLGSVPVSVKR